MPFPHSPSSADENLPTISFRSLTVDAQGRLGVSMHEVPDCAPSKEQASAPTDSLEEAEADPSLTIVLTARELDGFFHADDPQHEMFTVPSWLTPRTPYGGPERIRHPANVQIVGYNPATGMCKLQSQHGPEHCMYLPRKEVEKALGHRVHFSSDAPHVSHRLKPLQTRVAESLVTAVGSVTASLRAALGSPTRWSERAPVRPQSE